MDEQHVALPKLYGAPAYARPAPVVASAPRPFDPDDLPIEACQDEADRTFTASLPMRAWSPGGVVIDTGSRDAVDTQASNPTLSGRPFRLKAIAGHLLGDD